MTTDKVKAKIIELLPEISLRVLLVDKRKPKVCVLSKSAIEAGLRPKRHREDGLIVGESKDKRCWRVRWYKKDNTLMSVENYSKNFIQIVDDENSEPPIGIADVLRAIEKTKFANDIAVGSDGEFRQRNEDGYFEGLVIYWNLARDNYDDQDEATKAFIGSLILN